MRASSKDELRERCGCLLIRIFIVFMFLDYLEFVGREAVMRRLGMEDVDFMELHFKKTLRFLEAQLVAVGRKKDVEFLNLWGEMNQKHDKSKAYFASRLKTLDEKHGFINKALDQLSSRDLLSKQDFVRFYEEFKKSEIGNNELSLDEIRGLARQIVEEEIAKHAADGLGRVDYALATAGALVVHHSEPFKNLFDRQGDAEKMLKPSFGEPGQCFPLKGNTGFVQIRLRTAIHPEAITLEHVARSVAYDRSSAPRDCRVFGWLQGAQNVGADNHKMLLTEFTYHLEKSNAQTYNVFDSATSSAVDTIRFYFTSNHGSTSHTCICRLRVHGRQPNWLTPSHV